MSPPFIVVDLLVLPLPHGLSGRNMLNLFDILTYASMTQKDICSFELSLLSCLVTFVYQLIVKSRRAFVHRSKTPTLAPTVRSSQVARDKQRRHDEDPGRRCGKSPTHHSRHEEGQHARRSTARMAHNRSIVIVLPLTWSNIGACHDPCSFRHLPHQQKHWRVQLLLDFPPAAEKLDEWSHHSEPHQLCQQG